MAVRRERPFEPRGGTETPANVFFTRRKLLFAAAGLAALGGGIAALRTASEWADDGQTAIAAGQLSAAKRWQRYYPAIRDARFDYGRPQTDRGQAARYCNFYEFSSGKKVWRHVQQFEPDPWSLTITGLCRQPRTLDLDEFYREFSADIVERQYRHRCVERWAMAVPWIAVPLAAVLKAVDPLAAATHVRFVSFEQPEVAPHQASGRDFPWPYTEGLTLAEAQNELPLLAIGVYGQPLLKQHGAPLRLVVPWKYGYKSIKSVRRIELVDHEPATFWSTLNPTAYPFPSNVDPTDTTPWRQTTETMLGSGTQYPTQPWNGYGKWLQRLYPSL